MATGALIPDTQKVVIGTTCQITAIGRPLQATNLLSVSHERADVVGCNTNIMLVYGTGTTTTEYTQCSKQHLR